MGMRRFLVIQSLIAQQQAAQKQTQQQQTQQQGTAQSSGNTAGTVQQSGTNQNIGVVGSPQGETTSFNAGLLTYKKGKKEASQKLGTNNFAAIDEHQGQVLLG